MEMENVRFRRLFFCVHLPGEAGEVMSGTNGSTLEEARAAKTKAVHQLNVLPVVGVGITRVGDGYGLKVNLSQCVAPGQIPCHVDGVPLVAEVVGEIRKR